MAQHYLTLKNIVECEQVFRQYMADAHGMELPDDGRVKRTFFSIMRDVSEGQPSVGIPIDELRAMDLRQLNNLTLNIARDVFLESQAPATRQGAAAAAARTVTFDVITREQSSNRPPPLATQIPRPQVSSNRMDDAGALAAHERIVHERTGGESSTGKIGALMVGSKDDALGEDDFARRLATIEMLRNETDSGNSSANRFAEVRVPDIAQSDNQAIYRAGMQDITSFDTHRAEQADRVDKSADALIQPPTLAASMRVDRYITMAGFDRNWEVDKLRYSFAVGVAGYDAGCLQSTFKNVLALAVTTVIIPMDAKRTATTATVAASVGAYGQPECTFSHPFLLLNIENMSVNEGTNDAIRKSFTVLKYDNSYRGPNGRGYVILVPVQNEVKLFQPAPLTSLHNLQLSLTKPNGVLLSNARDDYQIEKLEYEAFNRLYIKIVTDKYFNKNEFFQGDSIYFRNARAELSGTVLNLSRPAAVDALTTFLNRPEGHDIVELGQPNDSNFYRTFYILAPGTLDQDAGKVDIDAEMTALIQTISSDAAASRVQGAIINASLQMIVSMTATLAVSDIGAHQNMV